MVWLSHKAGGDLEIEFVPVRWWQAPSFVRLNLVAIRGHDPWVDRVLSRPWSLSSLMEYGYMLAAFPRSDSYFVLVSGERAGTFWAVRRANFAYLLSLGLLPKFRRRGVGMLAAQFLREHLVSQMKVTAAVGRVAALNKPIQRMVGAFGGSRLGLATTRLTLADSNDLPSPAPIDINKVKKPDANRAWRKQMLSAAKYVSGARGAQVAADFLDAFDWFNPLPKGQYLALYQDGVEIGFAFARQREDELEVGLFPATTYWSSTQTAALTAALGLHFGAPIRYLTVFQKHADALVEPEALAFERKAERERFFVFWQVEDDPGVSRAS